MFDATAHEVKMLMMHTRATFYATQPINAAAYVPVEACGAHEWSYIRRHGCAALAADVAASQARRRPHHRRLRRHQAHRRRAPAATLTAAANLSHKS
jgi:hypothetical protein